MSELQMTIFGLFLYLAFEFGVRIGKSTNTIENKPKISLNPVKTIKTIVNDKKLEKEAQEETERLNTILENIEAYDGTEFGQKEVK